MIEDFEDEEINKVSDVKAIDKARKEGKLIIEEEDFVLIPTRDDAHFFDVCLLKIVKPKGKPERHEFKLVAYGATIQYSVWLITTNRLKNENSGSGMNLEEFLTRFEIIVDTLRKTYGVSARKK